MSNRATRRADLADFRREAHREHLLTYMIDATDNAALDRIPLLRRAVDYWRGNIPQRKPICPGCRASFANDAPATARSVSVCHDSGRADQRQRDGALCKMLDDVVGKRG